MLQIKVISFHSPPQKLVHTLHELFPESLVEHQPAVDLRRIPLTSLVQTGLASYGTSQAIENGRHWHSELPSNAGIGLAHALRLALVDDISRPLLIFEDDCVIHNKKKLKLEVEQLLNNMSQFDMATFGVLKHFQIKKNQVDFMPRGWVHVDKPFWGCHCVLYTGKGREVLNKMLTMPLEMQIDSLFGFMARHNQIRIIAQVDDKSAGQSIHISSVQTKPFLMMDVYPIALLISSLIIFCLLCFVYRMARRTY